MNRWTYEDKERERIPMENICKELKKYDTYSINTKGYCSISSAFQYSTRSLYNRFWLDRHGRAYDTMIFDAPYNRHSESRSELKIDTREIKKVEKVVCGRYKYDFNYIIFTFKDKTELVIFCHKMDKAERELLKKTGGL